MDACPAFGFCPGCGAPLAHDALEVSPSEFKASALHAWEHEVLTAIRNLGPIATVDLNRAMGQRNTASRISTLLSKGLIEKAPAPEGTRWPVYRAAPSGLMGEGA